MDHPLFSVAIPSYNRAHCLERALASVEAQTCDDWEIVLVDDGSTDDTPGVCERMARRLGKRFRYQRVDHSGVSAARNAAVGLAQGDFVAFLDSDDEFYPEKLAVQRALLARNPDADLLFSATRYCRAGQPDVVGEVPWELLRQLYPRLLWMRNSMITTPSVLARRACIECHGGFDEDMDVCEDIDLWRRMSRAGKVVGFSQPLVTVHTREWDDDAFFASLRGRLTLYEKALGDDPDLGPEFALELHHELLRSFARFAAERGWDEIGRSLGELADTFSQATQDALQGLVRTLRTAVRLGSPPSRFAEAAWQ
jgi:glycosyltransferase involved in cell wall biosynthesis